jgi:hypothetical protein
MSYILAMCCMGALYSIYNFICPCKAENLAIDKKYLLEKQQQENQVIE